MSINNKYNDLFINNHNKYIHDESKTCDIITFIIRWFDLTFSGNFNKSNEIVYRYFDHSHYIDVLNLFNALSLKDHHKYKDILIKKIDSEYYSFNLENKNFYSKITEISTYNNYYTIYQFILIISIDPLSIDSKKIYEILLDIYIEQLKPILISAQDHYSNELKRIKDTASSIYKYVASYI